MRGITVNIWLAFVVHAHTRDLLTKHSRSRFRSRSLYRSRSLSHSSSPFTSHFSSPSSSSGLGATVDKVANKLVDSLFNRALKTSSLHHPDVDSSTLGKHGHLAIAPYASGRPGDTAMTNPSVVDCRAYRQELLAGTSGAAPTRMLSSPVQAGTELAVVSPDFRSLMSKLSSPDNDDRKLAEKTFSEARDKDPNSCLLSLLGCMNPNTVAEELIRKQAATLLRRTVVHEESMGQTAWLRADETVRTKIKQDLLNMVLSVDSSERVRKITVILIANIAEKEPDDRPWIELVPHVFQIGTCAQTSMQQESVLLLLSELLTDDRYSKMVLEHRQELSNLITGGLGVAPLQAPSLELVASTISALGSKNTELRPVLPLVETALQNLATSDADAFENALSSFGDCAQEQPMFFRPRYAEWVDMMLGFARAKDKIEDGSRVLAYEWVASVAESRLKALIKAVPDFAHKVLSVAVMFISEVEEDESWMHLDDDEEEDDDDEYKITTAGEANIDFFVDKMGFSQAGKPLLALLQQCATSNRWQDKMTCATTIRASIEYVDDDAAVDTMMAMLHQLSQDGHMRVRYVAYLAFAQAWQDLEKDTGAHERWHSRLIPLLTNSGSTDVVNRCAAMALRALGQMIDNLDEEVLFDYSTGITVALSGKLTESAHKGVLYAVLEVLGKLASQMAGSFDDQYDRLMPLLLIQARQQDAQVAGKLRGKIFECISFLGYSVGKEKFEDAAKEAMNSMLTTPIEERSGDVQTEIIRESMERICETMGSDFAQFLPSVLPGMLSKMNLDSVIEPCTEGSKHEPDEVVVESEKGMMRVKTDQMEEVASIVNLLSTFIRETGAGFLPFVTQTEEVLSKILIMDPVSNEYEASSIRDAVYPCWAELVGVIAKAIPTQGQQAQAMAFGMVQRFVDKVGNDLVKAKNPDDITPMADGLASVIRKGGVGSLEPTQAKGMCELAMSGIVKSFEREKTLGEAKNVGEDEPEDEVDDLSEDDNQEQEEPDCRSCLADLLGACMKANPDVFVAQSWPSLYPMMQEWLGPVGSIGEPTKGGVGRMTGLDLASQICQHLGESAAPIWPVFMDSVLASTCAESAQERNMAAYTVLVAAEFAKFGEQYGAVAYNALAQNLRKFKPKKNDEDGVYATDNTVAAIVQLLLVSPSGCPDLDGFWDTVLAKLPLKADFDESPKVNRKLFNEVQQPNGGNLRSMGRAAKVLGYLCEIYGKSEHFDDTLQKDLAAAFCNLPQDQLVPLVQQFSTKQQKKVQLIMKEGGRL